MDAKKGHCLYECMKISAMKKGELLAILKSGDSKATKAGVVSTNVEEEDEEPNELPEDPDVQEHVDFVGQDNHNVGICDNKPAKDNPSGFSGIGFAYFQLGVELADV